MVESLRVTSVGAVVEMADHKLLITSTGALVELQGNRLLITASGAIVEMELARLMVTGAGVIVEMEPLQAPVLALVVNSRSQITVSWGAVAGATGYTIERSPTGSGDWVEIYDGALLSTIDTGLKKGTRYYYRGLAYNETGDGSYGATVSDVTMAAGEGGSNKPTVPPGKSKPKPHKLVYNWQIADLVAWWVPAVSMGSRILYDLVGNFNALMAGDVPWGWTPDMGGVAAFDGNSANYFNAGANTALCPAAMTIAAWVSFNTLPAPGTGYQWIIARDSAMDRCYALGTNGLKIRWNMASVDMISAGGPTLETGKLYHIVVTGHDGKAPGTWDLYVNGKLYDTSVNSFGIPTETNATYIGRREYAGNEEPLDGNLVDLRIYKRPLTAPEVWQLWDPNGRFDLYRGIYNIVEDPFDPPPPPPSGGVAAYLAAIMGSRRQAWPGLRWVG